MSEWVLAIYKNKGLPTYSYTKSQYVGQGGGRIGYKIDQLLKPVTGKYENPVAGHNHYLSSTASAGDAQGIYKNPPETQFGYIRTPPGEVVKFDNPQLVFQNGKLTYKADTSSPIWSPGDPMPAPTNTNTSSNWSGSGYEFWASDFAYDYGYGTGGASGGYVLYPNKPNTNMMRAVYSK
jgi:hypothetical protein